MTQATQTTQAPVTTLSQIDEVLMVISNLDMKVVESATQIENINDRRNAIAAHFIDVAKNLKVLTGAKSTSTMREKVYSVLAHNCKASQKMFTKFGMAGKAEKIIKATPNVEKVIEANKWRITLA